MIARSRNELWAGVLMDELARAGVRHVVVAPGSRSAPLVLAAHHHARIQVTVQIDERSAAFAALGIGKAGEGIAAVVTTSGTAVANLLPAVVEAAQSECPLLLLTADRPVRLRGADANQTIDQTRIFGGYVRLFSELSPEGLCEDALVHLRSVACRAVDAATGVHAGPVHLNLPFSKPLEPVPVPGDLSPEIAEGRTPGSGGRPDGRPWTELVPGRARATTQAVREVLELLAESLAPVLIAGVAPRPWDMGPAIATFATRTGVPVLADALSGARYAEDRAATGVSSPPGRSPASGGGPAPIVGGYDLALGSERVGEELRPDLILRVGAAPTSLNLVHWLRSLQGTEHILVDASGRWKDHAGTATRVLRVDPVGFLRDVSEAIETETSAAYEDYRRKWAAVQRSIDGALGDGVPQAFDGVLVRSLVERAADDDVLFVSNSMPVRDVDTFAPNRARPLEVFGNRGASGIDGIVSTAAGVALATGRRVLTAIGDLALLHDSNGLALLREPGVRVLLFVVNNDGGGIFDLLPIREFEPPFTRYFATPHGRDLGHLAALHELQYLRVDMRRDRREVDRFESALAEALLWETGGILEVRTDRSENRLAREEAVARIARQCEVVLDGTSR